MSTLIIRKQRRFTVRLATSTAAGRIFALIRGFPRLVGDGLARRSERRTLLEWADSNDQHLLRDIGMTREEAYREAGKWFWQR